MAARGKLIVLEGIDGSGKHTQLEMLARAMRERGVAHTTIDFPRYDGFFGKMVAQYLNGEFGTLAEVDAHFSALLFAGDRLENKKQLETFLNEGKLVLADRYIASNLAHQGARVAPRKANEFLRWLERLEYEIYGLPGEDLVIYLRLPAARAQKLVSKKNARSYTRRRRDLQEANLAHLQAATRIFERLARRRNWATVECMEGQSERSELRQPGAIHREIMAVMQSRVLAGAEDS
jgi:dTMP kinase